MRVTVPQITWHSRDPVLTLDIDPTSKHEDGYYRLATGGGDCQLLIWHLTAADTIKPELTCVAELKRHEKPINVVRFSPDGNFIASGGDDAYVIIWKNESKGKGTEETWQFTKSLRKHIEDVSDLSWSPDGNFLVSGSIDNAAVLWDIRKGVAVHVWSENDHSGFIHGVSYDPLHEFVATMCIDRNLRFFDIKSQKLTNKVLKYPEMWIPPDCTPKTTEADEKENVSGEGDVKDSIIKKKASVNPVNRLFHDEFLPTFCRRLSFSPNGELLMVPGGMLPPRYPTDAVKSIENPLGQIIDEEKKIKDKKKKKKILDKPITNNNAVVLFCRHSFNSPCSLIPTGTSYSIACRFCPLYMTKYREAFVYDEDFSIPKKTERSYACVGKIAPPKQETEVLMNMPYRLVYAVATNDSVIIGDTASSEPLAVVRNIHLARITDVTWAADGRLAMASSTDGYCSIISFDEGELGKKYPSETLPPLERNCFPILPPEPKPVKEKKKTPKPKATPKEGAKEKGDIKKVLENGSGSKKKSAKEKPKTSPIKEPEPSIVEAKPEDVKGDAVSISTPPKLKSTPQRTTLDRWIKKGPKVEAPTASTSKNDSKNLDKVQKPARTQDGEKSKSSKPPEVIEIDDDEPNPVVQEKAARIYPMTPPVKPISIPRKPSTPLLSDEGSKKVQKSQLGVSPEEIFKLKTAPIKCRGLMEHPPILMESSSDLPTQIISANQSLQEPGTSTQLPSPKITDPECPRSPVSSTGCKPPRRIQLITLQNPPNDSGNLD